ncbi:hypothetical protein [Flavobacterium akiainvivens]|nr:hypothetical protein [Flavobacterium akiainvivens]SFQ77870.1 hypothetical protein SAMN05444144_12720 [Flavobacterium akiainvivens]
MKKKVLVYDSEVGYYNLLKNNIKDGFEFDICNGCANSKGFDAVAFFMHDKIEALDIARLYSNDKPFILAADNGHAGIKQEENMYVINTSLPHDDILKMLKGIFNELQPQMQV